jgi:hypothetical protein
VGRKVFGVTAEITEPAGGPIRRTDVTVLSPEEIRRAARDAARRADVILKIIAITLLWLVSVSLLLGFGLTTRDPGPSNVLAALVAVVLPFAGAVLATRAHMPVLGGVYAGLTLAMATLAVLVPALGVVWWVT